MGVSWATAPNYLNCDNLGNRSCATVVGCVHPANLPGTEETLDGKNNEATNKSNFAMRCSEQRMANCNAIAKLKLNETTSFPYMVVAADRNANEHEHTAIVK